MARTSTLGSPGVEVREVDNSLRMDTSTACTAYLSGFAAQGPVEEVSRVSSTTDFINLYGEPTNAAERYFYHQAETFFKNSGTGATLLTSRLPYGTGTGDNTSSTYTVLAYPYEDKCYEDENKCTNHTYLIGSPKVYLVGEEEYIKIANGEIGFKTSIPDDSTDDNLKNLQEGINNAAFVIINKANTTMNKDFEGYYIGLCDNLFNNNEGGVEKSSENNVFKTNAVTDVWVNTKPREGDCIVQIEEKDYNPLNALRIGFDITGDSVSSLSRVLSKNMSIMDTSSEEYDDTLSIGIFKLNKSADAEQTLKLTYSLHERFNGSFGRERVLSSPSSSKPVTYFIENIANESKNIALLVNPDIAKNIQIDPQTTKLKGKIRLYNTKLVENYKAYSNRYEDVEDLKRRIGFDPSTLTTSLTELDSLMPIGAYFLPEANKKIGSVPYKLQRALELVENDEEYPDIDIVIDGGLSTIYAETNKEGMFVEGDESMVEEFNNYRTGKLQDDVEESEDENADVRVKYHAVQSKFLQFCNAQEAGGRGDSFFIGDLPRDIFIQGQNTKVMNLFGKKKLSDNVKHNWTSSIYYPIKHFTDGIVSSYASFYAQWFKEEDAYSGKFVWLPASAYVAAAMATTDQNLGPWYAAAGLNRGLINSAVDYAINPNVRQRTDLYKICINSIPSFPKDGLSIWGIRTMSKKPSAFDQNTCRRTFLYMEKKLKQLLRYYVFEPNTSYTRLKIYNDIKPFLDGVKADGGIYDYVLTCDASNNTPEIINNGDLAVDVAAAPTRTAENIILTMTANKYTGDVTVG